MSKTEDLATVVTSDGVEHVGMLPVSAAKKDKAPATPVRPAPRPKPRPGGPAQPGV